ncbi:uncharacterized protein LOC130590296 [Beta vulgaris subsp. vulgaris]|uniref:uncharacterized protein LOC130590296 n=1 Tax=Beta vulgaris subsp. vulgaris TaxID=3555 RepID=UPI002549BFFA|nr:uncharacterized protein LOC130590296 [Beta vulgaris subsp. vulgaris]
MGTSKGGHAQPVLSSVIATPNGVGVYSSKQRNMTVLEYAVKFNELARFAPDLVSTDRQRMNRFEGGLNVDLQEKLAAHMSKSYQELYDRAINVERKTKLRKEVFENGKRKGKPQEGQSSNIFHKKLNTGYVEENRNQRQVPRCNKCNKQGHWARDCRKGTDQCYRCGKQGHIVKDCPVQEQRGHNVNNHGFTRNQGNGQNSTYSGNANNNRNPPRGPPQAGRVFMMQREEAEADDTVITGTFPVHSIPGCVLFDSGASHSFISTAFSRTLNAKPCPKFSAMSVSIPNGESISCDVMYRNCPILIGGYEFLVDLVQFELTDFDVILGMDWLSKYQADINCLNHEITLRRPDGCKVSYRRRKVKPRIISTSKVFKLLAKGFTDTFAM